MFYTKFQLYSGQGFQDGFLPEPDEIISHRGVLLCLRKPDMTDLHHSHNLN